MTAPSDHPHASGVSPWSSPTSTRSYYVAALRAAAISLVLLVGLGVLILL